MWKRFQKEEKWDFDIFEKSLPWVLSPPPHTYCSNALSNPVVSTFPPISLVLHKPLARIHVIPFSCSIPSQYSEYLFIYVVNEMEKILTQNSSTYVPAEKFSNFQAQAATHFLLSEILWPLWLPVFLNRHCLIPWDCNASSLSASPPVSTYMHYLLNLLKSQRMN